MSITTENQIISEKINKFFEKLQAKHPKKKIKFNYEICIPKKK